MAPGRNERRAEGWRDSSLRSLVLISHGVKPVSLQLVRMSESQQAQE
jgi:hypothetical protein